MPPKVKGIPFSDELADGDFTDDKELEDEDDIDDDIVDDNGFVNLFKNKGQFAQIEYQQQIAFLQRQHTLAEAQSLLQELPSNEVANGDVSENKELEDQDDSKDVIVDNIGFVNQWKNKGDVA